MNKLMKSISVILIIFIFLIILGIIIFFVIKTVTKVEIFENLPTIKRVREAYLHFEYIISDFTDKSEDYSYGFYILNKFPNSVTLNIETEFFISEGNIKIPIYFSKFHGINLEPGIQRRFDVIVENIFDNSKISELNFCEREKSFFGYEYECYKGDRELNKICWTNCKFYTLDSKERNKNLYCVATPKISTRIEYSTQLNGAVEIEFNSIENRILWSVRESPLKLYLRPSILPYTNILPLSFTLEVEGYDIFIKDITIEVLDYSLEIETFFEKIIQNLTTKNKICKLEINKLIDGKVYLGRENECTLGPFEIIETKIKKDFVEERNLTNKEEIDRIVKNVCKSYIIDDKIDYSKCAEELAKRRIDLCKIYNNVEICNKMEEELRKIILLINVNFSKMEKIEKTVSPTFC